MSETLKQLRKEQAAYKGSLGGNFPPPQTNHGWGGKQKSRRPRGAGTVNTPNWDVQKAARTALRHAKLERQAQFGKGNTKKRTQ